MGLSDSPGAPAVRRAVDVLGRLAQRGGMTSSELAVELEMAKSSTSDLVAAMLDCRLLRKRDDLLTIGPLLSELTASFVSSPDVLERFSLHWPKSRLLSEHTVSVQAVLGTQNLCVDARLGRYLLPYTPRPGSRTDIWNGTSAEPVLRCLPAAEARRTLAVFAGFVASTQATEDQIRAWLDEHTHVQPATALIASTGNLELNVALSAEGSSAPPTVLTLHLPPRTKQVPPKLRASLEDLASIIVG